MARFTGPRAKVARRFNEPIFGPSKALLKKAYPPGQHGRGRRRKPSEYSVQLAEKQKAKYTYGVLERQFRKTYEIATRSSGVTGEILLQLLEGRLDNVVFRMGIAPTRRAARQFVGHNHITVNGQIVNIPSYHLRPGDVVGVRTRSRAMGAIQESLMAASIAKYPWLTWDQTKWEGQYQSVPVRDQIPENIQEQLIVELYSK